MLSEGTLNVTVYAAHHLANVEHIGRNDPYVKLYLNLEEPDRFEQTEVREDAGEQATWDERFEFSYNREPELFVEVYDHEKGADKIIGFAAIPLQRIGPISAVFDIYQVNGKPAGGIHLGINSNDKEYTKGPSHINEDHLKIMKSKEHKAIAGDAALALFGGALALGTGAIAKHAFDEYRENHPVE